MLFVAMKNLWCNCTIFFFLLALSQHQLAATFFHFTLHKEPHLCANIVISLKKCFRAYERFYADQNIKRDYHLCCGVIFLLFLISANWKVRKKNEMIFIFNVYRLTAKKKKKTEWFNALLRRVNYEMEANAQWSLHNWKLIWLLKGF